MDERGFSGGNEKKIFFSEFEGKNLCAGELGGGLGVKGGGGKDFELEMKKFFLSRVEKDFKKQQNVESFPVLGGKWEYKFSEFEEEKTLRRGVEIMRRGKDVRKKTSISQKRALMFPSRPISLGFGYKHEMGGG